MRTTRRLAARIAIVAGAITASVIGTSVVAQHDVRDHHVDPADSSAWLKGDTQKENEAYDLYKANKLLTARTRAEEALAKNPDSILARFVLGAVFREAEGDLPRAMFHLGKARELVEQKYSCAKPPINCPWKFHRDLLFESQLVAGDMEEYEYQLQLLDYYQQLNYEPSLGAERAWPLMKLGRFDEARANAKKAIESSDPQQQVTGRNALCAIEGEAKTRQPWYDACLAAYEAAKKTHADAKKKSDKQGEESSITVHAFNAALAAQAILRFDEVEKLAREGTKSKALSVANPWRMLTGFYTTSGRVVEAMQAVRSMQTWRAHEPASLRDQDTAETDAALATMLMMAGESESALKLVGRAIDRPDRRGVVSGKSEQALGAHALLRRSLQRMEAEQMAERASYSSFGARVKSFFGVAAMRISTWPDDERIASILSDPEMLDSTFRIYLAGGLEPVPTWMLGDLIDIVGAGVVAVVLERVRKEEEAAPDIAPALASFYDAIEAEVLLAQGDLARAVELAERALKTLPKAEAILAARTAAVGAEAARRRGDAATAMRLFEVALQRDSGVIRRLGFAVPATVQAEGDAAAQRAATLIARSPRLRETPGAFTVGITMVGAKLKACLRSPQGAELTCAMTPPKKDETTDAFAERLAKDFHSQVFTLTFGMGQRDLQSLDGSISVADQAEREKMKGMLRGLAGDDENADPKPEEPKAPSPAPPKPDEP